MFSVNFEKMKLFLFFVVVGLGIGCKMKDPCEKCVSHCTFVEFHDAKSLCLMSAFGISGVRFLIPPGGGEMCSSEEIDSVKETPHGMESENARTQEESRKERIAHFPKKVEGDSEGARMDRVGGTLEGAHSSGMDRAGGISEGAHFPKKVGGISEGAHSQGIDRVEETLEGTHSPGMEPGKSEKHEETGQKSFEGRNETNQKMDEGGFPWWGFLFIGIVSFCLILVVFGLVLNVFKTKYHRHRDDCYDHL